MTTVLHAPPGLPALCEDIPYLSATTWMEFKFAIENLFLSVGAGYLINPTPSTIIPPQFSLLNMFLVCPIWTRVDAKFQDLVQDDCCALQAWIAVCHFHTPVDTTSQPVDTTPIPDDSYATVRTSMASIIPSPVIPSSMPFIPSFNSTSAGPVHHAFKKHHTLSILHGFKKHFAAMPSPVQDFQYEVYLYCSKWLDQVPGPGPPSFHGHGHLQHPSLYGLSGCNLIFSFFCFSRVLIQWVCWNMGFRLCRTSSNCA